MSEAMSQSPVAGALHPMAIGQILTTAFQLYRRHWRTLMAIAAVIVVPLTLLHYVIGYWVRTQGEVTTDQEVVSTSLWVVGVSALLAGVVALLLYQVLTGAITRAIAAEVAGEELGVDQSYRFGFARLGSILLVSILVGLATLGGLILLIIPGIYIGVRLAVSIEALVVEGKKGTEAMRRSWDLVGGHWWHAFGTLLVAALIVGLVSNLITTLFNGMSWFIQGLAAAVATVVTMPYGALIGVLLYLDLRARKEQLDLDRLKADLQASAV
jgi:hypothetical protein